MLKVTIVYELFESAPHDCEVNDSGYILLPADPNAIGYNIFAPFHDEKETGPWYWLRFVKANYARRSRYTVVADYKDHELAPRLCPTLKITFPTMVDDQDYWYLYGNGRPVGLFGRMGSHYKLPSGDVDQ